MPEDAKHRGFTYSPEFNIVLFAILLNWPWEFLQVPFYGDMPSAAHWQGIQTCTQATVGDGIIMLVAYWCVAASAGRYWVLRPTFLQIASLIAVGLGITVVIERLATRGAWIATWSYSERMAIVPLLGIGVAPFLQWLVLPPLAVWFCKRQLGPWLPRSDGHGAG